MSNVRYFDPPQYNHDKLYKLVDHTNLVLDKPFSLLNRDLDALSDAFEVAYLWKEQYVYACAYDANACVVLTQWESQLNIVCGVGFINIEKQILCMIDYYEQSIIYLRDWYAKLESELESIKQFNCSQVTGGVHEGSVVSDL